MTISLIVEDLRSGYNFDASTRLPFRVTGRIDGCTVNYFDTLESDVVSNCIKCLKVIASAHQTSYGFNLEFVELNDLAKTYMQPEIVGWAAKAASSSRYFAIAVLERMRFSLPFADL